jgi:hypothetical protein
MSAERRWRQLSDGDILDASRRLHDYTDEGQAIIQAELQRRGLAPGEPAESPAPAERPQCRSCGSFLKAGDAFCSSCGAPLTPSLARPAGAAEGAGPIVWRTNVLLMVALTVATGGLYYPYWFLSRRPLLNLLRGPEKVGVLPFAIAILLLVLNAAIALQTPVAANDPPAPDPASLQALALLVELGFGLTLLVQCFKVRRMIAAHLDERVPPAGERTSEEAWGVALSALAVFFFGIFYLQHLINTRLPNERLHVVPE